MDRPETTDNETEVLRERTSQLSAAILRIGGSLDVDTVLRTTAEEARALTGARFGAVAMSDESGSVTDYVTSGLTPEQHDGFANWSAGPLFFEHLRQLGKPLRLLDVGAYVRSLGWPSDPVPCKSFQGAPMIRAGVHVGTFFLGAKEGEEGEVEFTAADEELLVLFASQAASAIHNAQTYRDERRLRADLETLVETTPVGVVVFDAETHRPLRANQEARRIVADLETPGMSLEEVATTVTCRRGDGREASLDQIGNAETIRAEEVELMVPDGRSVRMLVSAAPSHSRKGEPLSVVVTMQDLAALEDLERSRAAFLSMVSHELRAPLAAIKGSAATVLRASRAYDPSEMQQFFRIVDNEADRMEGLIADLLDMGRIQTGTLPVTAMPTAVAGLLDRARTTFLSSGGRNPLKLDVPADLPRVAVDERRIEQVLNNLIGNAARHSPDSAPIEIVATQQEGFVEISVTDKGEGVSAEQLPHLFRKQGPGGDASRTGLGLAICKGLVEAHGGRIRAESDGPGAGTKFTFTIPVSTDVSDLLPAGVAASRAPSGQTGRGASVLVVDDDPRTTRYVRDVLAEAGYAPFVTANPDEVPELIGQLNPHLVLMDLMLPNTDGIELLRGVPGLADRPVIFISAYGRDETIARALEAGACDYIVKPFSPTELTARVGAALRGRVGLGPFEVGQLAIDFDRHRVTLAGEEIPLTPTEYELLTALSSSGDRVLTYGALQRRLWPGSEVSADRVRTFVKKLRAKLDDPATDPKYIVNVRGIGYRMAGQDE